MVNMNRLGNLMSAIIIKIALKEDDIKMDDETRHKLETAMESFEYLAELNVKDKIEKKVLQPEVKTTKIESEMN